MSILTYSHSACIYVYLGRLAEGEEGMEVVTGVGATPGDALAEQRYTRGAGAPTLYDVLS